LAAWLRAVLLCGVVLSGIALPGQTSVAPSPQDSTTATPTPAPSPDTSVDISSLRGLRVASIDFQGAGIERPEHLRDLLAQKVGEPLDKLKIRQSIQALYATGRFADIRVDAQRDPQKPGEVALIFVARENYFLGAITLDGVPRGGPRYSQLINAAKLDLGVLYSRQKIDDAISGIDRALEDGGYYRATVTAEFIAHAVEQQLDVHFHIVPGTQARIGAVTVNGDPGMLPIRVLRIAHMQPGSKTSQERVTKALERLRKHYSKEERIEAQVAMTARTYDSASNTVNYTFEVERGPKIDVRVDGARIRKGLVKKYVPIYEENAVDVDLLNEGERNLRDYFQTKGFFDAKVSYTEKSVPAEGLRDIVYDVDRGVRHKLVSIAIEGNRYFNEETIRERMSIQPANWLLAHGLFSQSMLARDVDSITNLYRTNGFADVKVIPETQDNYQGRIGHIAVLIRIEEGQQTRVHSLAITGTDQVPLAVVRQLVNMTEGQPYSDVNLGSDRDSVVGYYFDHGFADVRFEAESHPVEGDAHLVDVSYKITEGRQTFVDHVVLSGLEHTRPYVVTREYQLHDGDPLSQTEMYETQRRLYDLGIFNEVDVAVQNPDGDAQYKNVLYQTYEARRYTFTYGAGLEIQTGSEPNTRLPQGRTGISPRFSFDVTRLNFLGRDHTVSLKTQVGRLEQRALFTYEAPHWFDREDVKLTFNAFYDTTADVRTFTAERLEGSVQLEQTWSRITTLLYRFAYRRVKVDPTTLVIDPALIPLLSKPVRVGMPSFTYIRDKRDDPLESHKGTYNTLDAGVSTRYFGSEASFTRFFLQNSSYYPFKRQRWVLARSTIIGIEDPIQGSTLVPLPERFYAGGGNSHRGFAINQAGPRDPDTGFPVGGDAMFLNSLELRMPPLQLPFVGNNKVSPVLFHDMGNVFAQPSDMWHSLFRWHQPNQHDCTLLTVTAVCSFNYLSHAVGAGIRYRTPIGPVRVDFGYNLNPPVFPVRRESRAQTLGHFNFYFSIGQTF
jgi:outer membrane protein insertion porin family